MAGKANVYLSRAVKYLDRLSGNSARDWKVRADVLTDASEKGITPLRAQRMARVAAGRSFQTRAKTGVVGGAAVTGGFLGLHKYHQHKDNEILRKIDSMYGAPAESDSN